MKLTFSGTTYYAGLQDIEPVSVTPVFDGCRVTLDLDEKTWEERVDKLAEVAADYADEGGDEHWKITRAIYRDIERNDIRMGRVAVA